MTPEQRQRVEQEIRNAQVAAVQVSSDYAQEQWLSLADALRALLAERDALAADNERLRSAARALPWREEWAGWHDHAQVSCWVGPLREMRRVLEGKS